MVCGRKILDQEPLALRQYQTCCQILETELDVPPMAETRTLRAQIFQKTGEDRGQSLFQDELASAQQTHQQLQKALLLLDKTTEQLSRSLRLLEKIFQNYPALEKS